MKFHDIALLEQICKLNFSLNYIPGWQNFCMIPVALLCTFPSALSCISFEAQCDTLCAVKWNIPGGVHSLAAAGSVPWEHFGIFLVWLVCMSAWARCCILDSWWSDTP